MTGTKATTDAATAGRVAAPTRTAPRARDLFAAEWIKLWSLRSTPLVLGACVLLYVYLPWRGARRECGQWPKYDAGMRDGFDFGHTAFNGPQWFLMMIAAGAVGAMTVAGEHASGQIRQTFAAVPARRAVLLAKAAVLAVVMTGVGAVVAGGSSAVVGHTLSGCIGTAAVPDQAWRASAATMLLVPVCALVGMALATLIRHSAGTVFAVCALFVFVPEALKSPQQDWLVAVANATPWYAWGRLTATGHGHVVGHIPTVTGSWVALAGWAVCSVAVAAVATHAREV
ncbi:MAG: ABC transporter permease subunit [Streptomycetaceae bacterium]|nr:ABC transporter permease subunit [Streptomycetaceae bacterium]